MLHWQTLVGFVLALMGWLLPRRVAGARLTLSVALLFDVAPSLLGFVVFAGVTARPIFAGVLVFALMGGFAFLDYVKRATLLEPVVFVDLGEAVELFRHPQLYLPFAGPIRVILGAIVAAGLFIAVFIVEPTAWPWSVWIAIIVPGVIGLLGWAAHGPFLEQTAGIFRTLAPSGDPIRDAAKLGPSALQFTYSLIARAERPARRAAANRSAPAIITPRSGPPTPVIVMQCESFFDPRPLHPSIPANLLSAFDACRRTGVQSGRLTVPGWGANTTRSEFAVLTGLSETAIGYDRFNPYYAFARAPIASLASRMRLQGYRTICLHPFDRTFYRRDQVMLNLGFDVFLGEEAFAGASRSGDYILDVEVARVAIELMREEGPNVFIFGITMENHGPWELAPSQPFDAALKANMPSIPEKSALRGFIRGIKNADVTLGMLADALTDRGGPGLCAFYGDHLPSFPGAFAALDFHDRRTDYVIWRPDGGPGLRKDLSAHALSDAIFDAIATPAVQAEAVANEGRQPKRA